jgi:hypothetical protein
MGRVEKVRNWMTLNKVFFEVAAAVLIGTASLVVSISALRVSEKTLVATEVAALPHFTLSKRPQFDADAKKFIEETLALNNHGAPVSNVSWTVRTFLRFERYQPASGATYVPLVGYYFAQYPTSSPTGELSSIVGHRNLSKFAALRDASLNLRNDSAFSPYPSLVTISVVNYEDRLGHRGATYFRDYDKVSEADVEQLLEFADKVRGVDVDSLTLEEVLAAVAGQDGLTLLKK